MTTISNRAIGYRVYDAINAGDLEALEKLFDPQVVRHATGETGFESARAAMKGDAHFLMQKLRSTASTISIPMIVVSTEPIGEKDAAKLKQESGRAHIRFLAKPIDTDELLAVVRGCNRLAERTALAILPCGCSLAPDS